MSCQYSDQERWERASLRAVHHMRGLWEEKGSSDTRLLEAFFLPDEFTIIGQSQQYDGFGRREHVIPRLVIIHECHRMLEAGRMDAEIAQFLRDHVRIVLISHEECRRLDRKDGLGLRQTMPENWVFGDSIFARLDAAEIRWEPRARTVS